MYYSVWDGLYFYIELMVWQCYFYIHTGVCLSQSTVLRGARICSHAWVQSSIVGWQSTVGKWVRAGLAQGIWTVQVTCVCIRTHGVVSVCWVRWCRGKSILQELYTWCVVKEHDCTTVVSLSKKHSCMYMYISTCRTPWLKGWEPQWSNTQTIDLHVHPPLDWNVCVSGQGENSENPCFSPGQDIPSSLSLSHTLLWVSPLGFSALQLCCNCMVVYTTAGEDGECVCAGWGCAHSRWTVREWCTYSASQEHWGV